MIKFFQDRELPPAKSLGQSVPDFGTDCPENIQDIENTMKSCPPAKPSKTTLNTLKNITKLPLCSLLRQVCRLSGPKGRPSIPSLQKSSWDRVNDPAAESRRQAPKFAIALALASLATPALSDEWQRGSSFDAKPSEVVWSKNGFQDLAPKKKATPAAKSPTRALAFKYDPALTPVANLRNLISCAESGSMNYDAVVYGATVQPPALPTQLTIGQIKAWIDTTPGQNHAIGRYQFIPATFNRLVEITQIPDEALFTADLQDRWANKLIQEARYIDFVTGSISPADFMDNIAQVWAGLPLASGKSAHDGVGSNKATIARTAFETSIATIYPAQVAFYQAKVTAAKPQ